MLKRRVVITGMGVISPLGCDVETMWQNLIASKSGIRKIDTFDTDGMASKIAGIVNFGDTKDGGFNPDDYMSPMEQRKVDKFIIYAIAAATQAVKNSGFP